MEKDKKINEGAQSISSHEASKKSLLQAIRDLPHAGKMFVAGTSFALASSLSSCGSGCSSHKDTFFDEDHYLSITGKVTEPYMDQDVLLEEIPTVYDNILYAKGVNGMKKVENTSIYTTCQRMLKLESHINIYANKYNIPANKLLGLIVLESEGFSNLGNKNLKKPYNCYGYTQISVMLGKHYGIIKQVNKRNKKGKTIGTEWKDSRDNIDAALDVTCKFLSEIHQKYVKRGYADNNWSLTFASYHMGETHMLKILNLAKKKTGRSPNTIQELLEINNQDLGSEFMELKDESYKYYPKLLAAGRIYLLFKNNRNEFNTNVHRFLNLPVSRKPSLAEEYPWYCNKAYYVDSIDMKKGLESDNLFGLLQSNDDLIIDKNIGESSKNPAEKELMKMTSKASWGLLKFLAYYCPFDVKVTSLTRSQDYNTRMYKTKKGKWTSHATAHALDLGFPNTKDKKNHLKWMLYGLEVQGKIAFIVEGNHFHIIINPKYIPYFENIVDD